MPPQLLQPILPSFNEFRATCGEVCEAIMRVVRVAAAAFCCAIVIASLPADARGGRGRSIGSSRSVYVSAPARASPAVVAPQPRSSRAVLIGSGATFRSLRRAGDPGSDVAADATEGLELGGVPLATVEPMKSAYAECPADRLVGSGVGFCEIN